MGWSFGRKPQNVKKYFEEQLTWEGRRPLELKIVHLKTLYGAVERTDDRSVFAIVCLLKFTRDGEMGYKPMDESMGPVEDECPESILKLLTGPSNEWRDRCWENVRLRKERGAKRLPGTKLRPVGTLEIRGQEVLSIGIIPRVSGLPPRLMNVHFSNQEAAVYKIANWVLDRCEVCND